MTARLSSALIHWLVPHHTNNQRAKLLHPKSLISILGLFAIFQISLASLTNHYPKILGFSASLIDPSEVIRLTNLERQNQGLPSVKLDSQLSAAATQKAADMFAKDYWAHISPSGTQPWYFITQNNYAYRYAGENLARDFSNPESIVKAWLASPSHRDNLLNSKYQDIGVAVVDGTLGGRQTTLVVQLFGTRLAIANSKTSSPVQAAAIKPQATSTSSVASLVINPPAFSMTKYVAILLLAVFVGVLVVDLITVYHNQIARWTSKSFAHLTFTTVLLIAVTLISAGQLV